MKLGFALKKTKKSVLQGGGAAGAQGPNGAVASAVAGVFTSALPAKQSVEKVFVTDFDPSARAAVEFDQDGNVKRALVIPLIKANAWKGDSDGDEPGASVANNIDEAKSTQPTERMLTADELAAKELLADARSQVDGGNKSGSSSSHAVDLVIPMNGKLVEGGGDGDDKSSTETKSYTEKKKKKREREEDDKTREMKAKLFNFESQEKNRKKQQELDNDAPPAAPILRQNVVPGMDALEDMNDKFRLDVSMRPDEPDVHSSAYDMVPIEDFGAALLRGMGWKGSIDKDEKGAEPKPRHKLLGLGATIRPPIPGESKHKHRKKPSSSGQSRGSTTNKDDDNRSRHSGLNHTEASSSKDQRQRSSSPRRSGDRSGKLRGDSDRDSSDRRSSRADKEDRSRRREEERHHVSQSSSRRRSRSSERKSTRDRDSKTRSDRRHRDDDRRNRSRSRDRSSDRKRSSRG